MTRRTGSFGRAVALAAVAALVLVLPAATANEFALTVVSQTNTTITFSYPAQTGYGYLYSANGTVVSRTNDPSKTTVKFSKANSYEVAAIVKGPSGSYPVAPPPGDTTPPSVTLTAPAQGATVSGSIFVSANASDNVGVTKVEFSRDGTVFATDTTAPYSVSFDTTTLTNGAHTFGPRAYDAAGNATSGGAVSVTVNNVTPPPPTGFPDASNTGTPPGTVLHSCATTINTTGTYDKCQFNGAVVVNAANVHITNSLILGPVRPSDTQPGLVISDTTINCQCLSTNDNDTPVGIMENNYTLLRVNLYNAGHGAAAKNNVVIQDSYIHDLGGNTQAHKDGIFVGDGHNQRFIHNNVECADGPARGCTAAIGIFDDFSDVYDVVIDGNLLNSNGAYCFYASGGPGHPFRTYNLTFTNNQFGRKFEQNCAVLGPVTYWDASQPGMVWSNNTWQDTGQQVQPVY